MLCAKYVLYISLLATVIMSSYVPLAVPEFIRNSDTLAGNAAKHG